MNIVNSVIRKRLAIEKYFYYSVIVSFVDTGIVWMLVRYFSVHLIAANTIGVVIGFLLHYILASKSVFNTNYRPAGFIVYLATFFAGLMLADWLIYMSYHYVFTAYAVDLRLLLSKGVSIAVPFFAMYYMRKYLFLIINKRR